MARSRLYVEETESAEFKRKARIDEEREEGGGEVIVDEDRL